MSVATLALLAGLSKISFYKTRSTINPRSVNVLKIEGKAQDDNYINSILFYTVMYVLVLCIFTLILSFDPALNFEGAATSDPIPLEPYTHSLKKAIEFFGKEEKGRFRFVTKFNDVDSLLDAKHNNHTEIRFSINTQRVIDDYEHHTSSANKRIEAAVKAAKAGYQIGFIIAPVFLYENWKEEYKALIHSIKEKLPQDFDKKLIFEVISHRYTSRAKNRILQIFPETTLPMNEEERKFKDGQFGYGKYIYTKEQLEDMKVFFKENIKEVFPNSVIKYVI